MLPPVALRTVTIIALHLGPIASSLEIGLWVLYRDCAMGGFCRSTRSKWLSEKVRFSNESVWSAPIAAAAAKTTEPVEQGLISMTEPLLTLLSSVLDRTLQFWLRWMARQHEYPDSGYAYRRLGPSRGYIRSLFVLLFMTTDYSWMILLRAVFRIFW